MANKPLKFSETISNATVGSVKLNLKFPESGNSGKKKNAYRLDSLRVMIDDLDAEADADLMIKIQGAYEDLAGKSLLTINDANEIFTLASRYNAPTVGTNAGPGVHTYNPADEIRDQGKLYLDGRDFKDVFFVKETVYINLLNSGQDADEEVHLEMKGKYVHLPQKDIDDIKDGNTLQ